MSYDWFTRSCLSFLIGQHDIFSFCLTEFSIEAKASFSLLIFAVFYFLKNP